VPLRIPKMQDHQSLTLHWRSFSWWGRERLSPCLRYKGSQCIWKWLCGTIVNNLPFTIEYLNAPIHRGAQNAEREIGTNGSRQPWQNPWVDGYGSRFAQPRGSRSGFWTGLELNQPVFTVWTRTPGEFPGPVANSSQWEAAIMGIWQENCGLATKRKANKTRDHIWEIAGCMSISKKLGAGPRQWDLLIDLCVTLISDLVSKGHFGTGTWQTPLFSIARNSMQHRTSSGRLGHAKEIVWSTKLRLRKGNSSKLVCISSPQLFHYCSWWCVGAENNKEDALGHRVLLMKMHCDPLTDFLVKPSSATIAHGDPDRAGKRVGRNNTRQFSLQVPGDAESMILGVTSIVNMTMLSIMNAAIASLPDPCRKIWERGGCQDQPNGEC